MRGAGMRLKHDVRRLWRCSVCGAERKAGAETTALRCVCPGQPTMKLIETQRAARELKELASPYLEFEFEPGELAAPGSFCRPVEAEQPLENAPQQEASDFGDGVELPAAPSTQPATRLDNRSGSPRQQSRGPGPVPRNEGRPSDRPRRDGPPNDRSRSGPSSGPKNGPGGPPPQGERRPPRDRSRQDRSPRGPQSGSGESGGPLAPSAE